MGILPGYIRKQWTDGCVPDTKSLSQVNVPHLDSLLRHLVSSFGLGFLSFKLQLSEADSDSVVFPIVLLVILGRKTYSFFSLIGPNFLA